MKITEIISEGWSQQYKSSINCSHPKGFSQRAHCAGKKKHNESVGMEMVCESCGMCQTHGSLNEIAKGAKDSNGYTKCWPGKHAEGTKKGKNGGQVRNCVPNESAAEGSLNELSSGLLQKAALLAKNKMNQAMEPELHNALGGGYMNPLAKYYDDVAQKMDNRAAQVGKKETIQKNASKIASPAVMRKLGMPAPAAQGAKPAAPPAPPAPGVVEDWNSVNKKDKTNGLSQKAVNAYRRENPGSKLQTAVTTKPSKLKAGSKAAERRKSFCARMSGNKGPMKKPNGDPSPKALALRRWNCESVEHMVNMIIENMDHDKDNQAVPELKAALLDRKAVLKHASEDQVYNIIDKIMTRIAKSHGISGQKLHDMWVKEYDQIPDTWIMKEDNTEEGMLGFLATPEKVVNKHKTSTEEMRRYFEKEKPAELPKYGNDIKKTPQKVYTRGDENFADGKHPEDKGDSARHGIPKHASISKLRKIAHQGGRKGQLAHWQANMRSGRNK